MNYHWNWRIFWELGADGKNTWMMTIIHGLGWSLATAQLYKSGAIVPIYNKWFLATIPPKNVNLNVPVSTPLKNEFANPTNSGDPAVYK